MTIIIMQRSIMRQLLIIITNRTKRMRLVIITKLLIITKWLTDMLYMHMITMSTLLKLTLRLIHIIIQSTLITTSITVISKLSQFSKFTKPQCMNLISHSRFF